MKKFRSRFAKLTFYKEIEKKLLPRLHFMGYLLFFFSLSSLAYAFFAAPYSSPLKKEILPSEEIALSSGLPEFTNSPPFELTEMGRINFYVVSAIFFLVGSACIYSTRKRKRRLKL